MKNKPDVLTQLHADIAAKAQRDAARLINLRRKLHQYPEPGHQEFRTTQLLKKELRKLGLDIFDDGLETGLWAQLDARTKGPVIAVRTDIDALPVRERTGLPFASKRDGFMHACGHDVHMAVLVGVARALTECEKHLRGTVKFLCQPAEEVPPGGARILIDAGALKHPAVDAILALHVDPELPTGTIGIRDGVSMAAVFDFDLRVIGRSGHAALPHNAVDAVAVAAQIITGIQQIVSRMTDPVKPTVITFGTVKGGGVRNVVAGEVTLEGTARTLDESMTKKLPKLISKTAQNIARGFGARVEVKPIAEYPVLKSDARVNRYISDSFRALYPKNKIHRLPVIMGAEDFACYLERIPGAMFRLGVGNRTIGADKTWHDPAFMIDEDAIPIGVATMSATVINMLCDRDGGIS